MKDIRQEPAKAFVPRTALGRKLLSPRNRAIKVGMKLLSADEALEGVKRRHGELEDGELLSKHVVPTLKAKE